MELIKEILLGSEISTSYIGDAEDVVDLVYELKDDGICFYLDNEEIEDMFEDNDILQITKFICGDCGKIEYHLERVLDENDNTIYDELDLFIIDSDILDIVDLDQLNGEIVPIEIEYDEEEFEDGDFIGDILCEELFESLSEVDKDDIETMIELIADKLQEAYECGRDDSLSELAEAVDAIKSLK